MTRRWLALGGAGVICGFIAWRMMSGPAFSPELAIALPVEEKRQILAAVREESYRQVWTSLRSRRWKAALGWFNSSWRHKIVSVARQGDGDIWVHVGVHDRKQAAGYSVWGRHILRKQNGRWTIVWTF